MPPEFKLSRNRVVTPLVVRQAVLFFRFAPNVDSLPTRNSADGMFPKYRFRLPVGQKDCAALSEHMRARKRPALRRLSAKNACVVSVQFT